MIFLFYSLKEKLTFILKATFQHAKNLAFLSTMYKTLLLILRKLQGRTLPIHNFIGAFVAGYFVFGENNKVNMQVRKALPILSFFVDCDHAILMPADQFILVIKNNSWFGAIGCKERIPARA